MNRRATRADAIERVKTIAKRKGGSPLRPVRRRNAAGAQRSRVRRDRRLLVHGSRQHQPEAPHAMARLYYAKGRMARRSPRYCASCCRRMASASRRTARRCITRRLSPAASGACPLSAPRNRGFRFLASTPGQFRGQLSGTSPISTPSGVQADGGVCVGDDPAGRHLNLPGPATRKFEHTPFPGTCLVHQHLLGGGARF